MLSFAYSSASALLTAGIVDFDSTASSTPPLGWSATTAEMFTTCPAFCCFIGAMTCCVI